MSSLYHARGVLNALCRQPAWHLREWCRNGDYRAFHRFARQVKGDGRGRSRRLVHGGVTIETVDGPSFLSAWDEIFVNRIYDLGDIAGRPPVLVDAGANIGLAALYWKKRYGDFTYLGFEPDPVVAACCRRNLEAWDVRGRLLEMAVGDRDGEMGFIPDGADGGRLATEPVAPDTAQRVKVGRLSDHLPDQVDLLKIDVEGAEGGVLADVAPRLAGVAAVFVEWHSRAGQAGLGRAITLLEEAGFNCHVQVAIGRGRPFLAGSGEGGFYQNINLYGVRS